jgi:hypothetical protein
MPTPEEWQKLKAEWKHDYGLRRLEDRGVKYEDEVERKLDHAAARGKGERQVGERQVGEREGQRLPSLSDIARDPRPYLPEPGHSNDHSREM